VPWLKNEIVGFYTLKNYEIFVYTYAQYMTKFKVFGCSEQRGKAAKACITKVCKESTYSDMKYYT
jgi:hypothetical protein